MLIWLVRLRRRRDRARRALLDEGGRCPRTTSQLLDDIEIAA